MNVGNSVGSIWNRLCSNRPLCLLVIAIAVAIAHSGGLRGPFIFDDRIAITDNSSIQNANVFALLAQQRGAAMASFRLNYLFGQFKPIGYRAFNLMLHFVAAAGLYGVMRQWLVHRRQFWPKEIGQWSEQLSLVIALWWSVHPITTQAVTYVVQRMEAGWSALFLVGYWLFLTSQRPSSTSNSAARPSAGWVVNSRSARLVGSIACFWLGLGFKEPLLGCLIVLPVSDYLFERSWSFRDLWTRRWKYYSVLLVPFGLLIPFAISRLLDGSKISTGGIFAQAVTPWEYWRTQPEAMLIYLRQIMAPFWLCFDHGRLPQDSLLALTIEWSILVALVTLLGWGLLSRNVFSLFGVLWFGCLAITAIVPLSDLVVEHRAYLASGWAIGLIAVTVTVGVSRWRSARRGIAAHGFLVVLGLASIVGCMALCFKRTSVYSTELSIWEDTVKRAPWNYRAHYSVAHALIELQRPAEAVPYARQAVESASLQRQPDFQIAKVYDKLATALSHSGRVDEAIQSAQTAVALAPDGSEHLLRLASVYSEARRFHESEQILLRAIANRPQRGLLYQQLGRVRAELGNWESAGAAFEQASQLSKNLPGIQIQIAQIDWMLGNWQTANRVFDQWENSAERKAAIAQLVRWLNRAKRFDEAERLAQSEGIPTQTFRLQAERHQFAELLSRQDFESAQSFVAQRLHAKLTDEERLFWLIEAAKLSYRTGHPKEALESFNQLLNRHAGSAAVHQAMGDVYRWDNQFDQAILRYRQAVDLGAIDSQLFNNLGALLSPTDPQSALGLLDKAIQIDPHNPNAWHSRGNTLLRLGKQQAAIAAYKQALTVEPDFGPSVNVLQRLRQLHDRSK